MSRTTDLPTFKINYLTQNQYESALENNQINSDELYCVAGEVLNLGDWILDGDTVPGHLSLRYNV